MTNYYDVNLKKSRKKILCESSNFCFYEGLVQDQKLLDKIFLNHKPNIIIHLAAQAGVRYSIENPISYVETNLIGTFHILEIAKKYGIDHLLIASTSSTYGSNKNMPLHENLTCLIFQLPYLDFLLFMVHGVGLTWLCSNLQKIYYQVIQLTYITMET